MRDITHTVALIHKVLHTWARNQANWITQMHKGIHKRLHTVFVGSVSHSATCTSACNNEAATHLPCQWFRLIKSTAFWENGFKGDSENTLPASLYIALCAGCLLTFVYKEAGCRFYGIRPFIETAGAVWMRLLVWNSLIGTALAEVKRIGKSRKCWKATVFIGENTNRSLLLRCWTQLRQENGMILPTCKNLK